jgi:hypothetical protein
MGFQNKPAKPAVFLHAGTHILFRRVFQDGPAEAGMILRFDFDNCVYEVVMKDKDRTIITHCRSEAIISYISP